MIDGEDSGSAGRQQPLGAEAADPLVETTPSRRVEAASGNERAADIQLSARPNEATGEPAARKACSIDEYCDYLRARYRSGTPEGELAQARLILAGWTPPELDRMWIPA